MVSYPDVEHLHFTTRLSLNPYCSGRWSRTFDGFVRHVDSVTGVLILIVVEDGLVHVLDNDTNKVIAK